MTSIRAERVGLEAKIKVLHEELWEDKADGPAIEAWLNGFDDAGTPSERFHALYLLSQAMYFGSREIRELLRAAYRDLYRYPAVERIRRAKGDTTDPQTITSELSKTLRRTKFLGMGNPAESGTHLLYLFRQVNELSKKLFISPHELFDFENGKREYALPDVEEIVFIDDFCGSGTQAEVYSRKVLRELKALAPQVSATHIVLFGCSNGLRYVRDKTAFDRVEAVLELDDSYRVFSTESRYFKRTVADKASCELMCATHGARLYPDDPLGHDNGQLLIAFHHNTPDNTLPVIWYEGKNDLAWRPIFRRFPKVYSWANT
jgi:hypothetical protein